jgi:hypothetical protein
MNKRNAFFLNFLLIAGCSFISPNIKKDDATLFSFPKTGKVSLSTNLGVVLYLNSYIVTKNT